MGANPPLRRERERRDQGPGATRDYWFAQQLGEQWESDGSGIYRLVAEKQSPEAVRSSDRASRAEPTRPAPSHVDDLIAELAGEVGDTLGRARDARERDEDHEPASEQPSRGPWRRH